MIPVADCNITDSHKVTARGETQAVTESLLASCLKRWLCVTKRQLLCGPFDAQHRDCCPQPPRCNALGDEQCNWSPIGLVVPLATREGTVLRPGSCYTACLDLKLLPVVLLLPPRP